MLERKKVLKNQEDKYTSKGYGHQLKEFPMAKDGMLHVPKQITVSDYKSISTSPYDINMGAEGAENYK